nr:MAG TPA: hypothetical protein [Caudoviricetes sp.]
METPPFIVLLDTIFLISKLSWLKSPGRYDNPAFIWGRWSYNSSILLGSS